MPLIYFFLPGRFDWNIQDFLFFLHEQFLEELQLFFHFIRLHDKDSRSILLHEMRHIPYLYKSFVHFFSHHFIQLM